MGIETHCSRKLVFLEKVLGEEDDADVSVVRTFRKHVGLLHEIVDNHQRRFFTVKVLDIRKTLVKFCVGILVKELLVRSKQSLRVEEISTRMQLSISLNTKRVVPQHVGPATIAVNGWMKGNIILLLGLRLLARATTTPAANATYNRR